MTEGKYKDNDYREQADARRALRRFIHFSEEQARINGVTPQQHLLLLMTRGHPSSPHVNIGQLAESLQVRHHSASLLVDRCVKRGLLRRAEDTQDRRRALICLTDKGQKILDRIMAANRAELRALEQLLFRPSFYADPGFRRSIDARRVRRRVDGMHLGVEAGHGTPNRARLSERAYPAFTSAAGCGSNAA